LAKFSKVDTRGIGWCDCGYVRALLRSVPSGVMRHVD